MAGGVTVLIGNGVFRKQGPRATLFSIEDMRAIAIENALIRVTMLLDKGADIIEFRDKATDTDFMWASPNGIRSPKKYMPTVWDPDGNYLDYYEGGWQMLFPSIGDPAQIHSAKLGIHGEACLLPFEVKTINENDDQVVVELFARMLRTPFEVTRTFTLKKDKTAIYIDEKIKNVGGHKMPFAWGHHPALGGVFLDGDVVVDIPAKEGVTFPKSFYSEYPENEKFVWPELSTGVRLDRLPLYPGKWAGLACVSGLSKGFCAAANPKLGKGFALAFDEKVFPNVWLWMIYEGMNHYPWFGNARVFAMEPLSSVPDQLNKAIEAGTALTLNAGEEVSTHFTAMIYDFKGRVKDVGIDGTVCFEEESSC